MANRVHTYIERIRNSDERTKKRFIIIASTLSMLVVVLLWVVYLNLTLPLLSAPSGEVPAITAGDTATEPVAAAPNTSFFGVIERGATVIGEKIANQFVSIKESAMSAFSKIGGLATKKNESVVTPQNTSFEPNAELQPIPSTKLPE